MDGATWPPGVILGSDSLDTLREALRELLGLLVPSSSGIELQDGLTDVRAQRLQVALVRRLLVVGAHLQVRRPFL